MKQTLILFVSALFSMGMQAQIDVPAASPAASLTQTVGLTDIKVEYSRPSMKGRKIFGDLLPFNKLWRTGANDATKFSIDKPITINDDELKAGTYSIFTIPGKSVWDIIFYTDDSDPLMNSLDDSKVALRTSAEVQQMPMNIETFTIMIDDITAEGAVLGMMWETAYVGIPFKVGTDEEVMATIDAALNGPSAGDYYNAAVYYLNSGKDIQKAKTWMDMAMEKTETPRYWQLRQQALILAKAGDKNGAVEAAKRSLAGAQEAKNDDYIRMNTASLKEWGAM